MKKHPILVLLFWALALYQVQAQQQPMPPLIHVTGIGEVRVPPTEVIVNLGVETREATLDAARSQTDKKAAAVIKYLKKQGIEDKYIQTSYVTLQQLYDGNNYGRINPTAYLAQKTMTVRIRKLNKFDEILAGIYAVGVNQVNGINFQVADEATLKDEARKKAVADARQKAQSLTTELGAKVGRVYSIQESEGSGGPRPMHKMAMMEGAAYDASGGPTIAAGEVVITTNVSVSFIIE